MGYVVTLERVSNNVEEPLAARGVPGGGSRLSPGGTPVAPRIAYTQPNVDRALG